MHAELNHSIVEFAALMEDMVQPPQPMVYVFLINVSHATISGVPAQLGLKAPALAWPEVALAFLNLRPGQSCHSQLGPGLAWLRPWLLYVK